MAQRKAAEAKRSDTDSGSTVRKNNEADKAFNRPARLGSRNRNKERPQSIRRSTDVFLVSLTIQECMKWLHIVMWSIPTRI